MNKTVLPFSLAPNHDYDDRNVECQSPNPHCDGEAAFDWEDDDYYECRPCLEARIHFEREVRSKNPPELPPLPEPNCEGEQAAELIHVLGPTLMEQYKAGLLGERGDR